MAVEIAIIGAGAMGCLFAARLAEQGTQVVLVDVDPARIAAINADGVTLTDDSGTRTIAVRACRAGDIAVPPALALVFTKSNHTAAAVRSIAHWREGGTLALTLQNGLGNAEHLAQAFGEDRVLIGTAHIPADFHPPSRVATHGFARLALGGMTPAAHRHAQVVGELLTRAAFEVLVTAEIEAQVWEKVAFNAALNATAMVCGAANADVDCEPGHRIARAIIDETATVARAKGIAIDGSAVIASVLEALAAHGHHKPSMLQDREAGRPGEIEAINGAIVRAAAECGVAVPVCATLADLVRLIERKELRPS